MVFCFYCGGSGHYKNECPTYRRDYHLCLVCGGAGHIAAVCPSANTWRNQRGMAYSSNYGSSYNSSSQDDRPYYRVKRCNICNRPGHLAKDCWDRDRYDRSDESSKSLQDNEADDYDAHIICRNCHKKGHREANCPEQIICRRCGEPGHGSSDCSNPVRCNRCLQTGHFAAECHNEFVCLICHETGHSAKDCPNNQ